MYINCNNIFEVIPRDILLVIKSFLTESDLFVFQHVYASESPIILMRDEISREFAALDYGNLITWLYDLGYPLYNYLFTHAIRHDAFNAASICVCFHVCWIELITGMNALIVKDNVDIIKLIRKRYNYHFNLIHARLACANGSINVLTLLLSIGVEWTGNNTTHAADRGHLNIIKYAVENNYCIHPDTTSIAETQGHNDICDYLAKNGY